MYILIKKKQKKKKPAMAVTYNNTIKRENRL